MELIDKLQKLLAHERSARTVGSIAEAEAFAAKIQELLTANKLTMSDIEIEKELQDEPVGEESIDYAPWSATLSVAVASATFCRVLRSQSHLVFIGSASNRAGCVEMFRYLAGLGESLSRAELAKWKQTEDYAYGSSFRPQIARTWRNSYLHGYASALYERLNTEKMRLESSARSAGSALLYVGKQDAAVQAFVDKAYPNLRAGRTSTHRVDGGAYQRGFAAGSSVSTQSRAALA